MKSGAIIHKVFSNQLTNFSFLWRLWLNLKFGKFEFLNTKHIKMGLVNSSRAVCAWAVGINKPCNMKIRKLNCKIRDQIAKKTCYLNEEYPEVSYFGAEAEHS